LHDQVLSDSAETVYKPEVTPAVAAAKQSYLGRVYLDWSQFPLTTDIGNAPAPGAPPPQSGWHTVHFQDLRFDLIPGSEHRDVLAGWVYIGPGNQVEAMYMNGREQK
jgi:inner membrane protein